ncbi:hypothetical protein GBO34_00835 [Roseivirga pacifica]|uniref:SprB repeat-containing protein n=1 Tax=Roseivirga pacifica TaxID=1267423 RepID=UPI0020941758|nr:SprB repeat-containing protein [Roseivirga pacifica]MCO6367858.1 hypothetical protein [Roseivirga pacifica]MCO6377230.1 hypothetical protein [Roseivirga pacifica]
MAKTPIGSNLNQYGNAGNFETDPSTWGYSPFYGSHVRSLDFAKLGIYSCKFTNSISQYNDFLGIANAKADVVIGNTYTLSAWIQIPSGNKISPRDADQFTIKMSGGTTATILSASKPTQATALDNWVQIEIEVEITGGSTTIYPYITFDGLVDGVDSLNSGGIIYVDKFEVIGFEEIEELCSVAIDVGSSVVTNETVADANDGSIQVSATGAGALEYSVNSGASWQSSNLFAGLAPGTYIILVREVANTDCTANTAFTIQEANPAFTINAVATAETVLGNSDGTITITPTGGVAPYQYSINGGSSFQSSNLFENLAPANYAIMVTDAEAVAAYSSALVNPGTFQIGKLSFSRNPIVFVAAKTGNAGQPNYRIYCDVLVEETPGTGSFTKKLSMALPPELGGSATFYLQEAFAGLFKPVPPPKGLSTIQETTGRTLLYKVGKGDLYGDLTEPEAYSLSNVYQAVLGGVSKKLFPSLDYLGEYMPDNKKWLSWRPTTRYIDADQEEFLTYFNHSAGINFIKLWAKAWYADGTTSADFDTGLERATSYAKHYEIPAGPNYNNVALEEPSKTVTKYQLWLQTSGGTEITERITFEVSPFRKANTRYFMCLNSLGAYEVVRFTGEATEEANFEKGTLQRFLGHEYTDPELASFNAYGQTSWKLSTGYYEGAEGYKYIKSLHDLMLSNQVYEITGGNRYPRLIMPGSVRIKQDNDSRYFLRVDAVDPYIEPNFTPDL